MRRGRQSRIAPIAGRKHLAGFKDLDADDKTVLIKVADKRARFLRAINLSSANLNVDGVSFGIIGHVDHDLSVAFLSTIALITRMLQSVSMQTTRKMRPSNCGILRNRR